MVVFPPRSRGFFGLGAARVPFLLGGHRVLLGERAGGVSPPVCWEELGPVHEFSRVPCGSFFGRTLQVVLVFVFSGRNLAQSLRIFPKRKETRASLWAGKLALMNIARVSLGLFRICKRKPAGDG